MVSKFGETSRQMDFYKQYSNRLPTNTSVLIDPAGKICQTYDKIHLFDVNVNSTPFCESESFSAGLEPKTIDIKTFKAGLSICFDCRFPELYRYYANNHCDLLFIPSSFTKTTVRDH